MYLSNIWLGFQCCILVTDLCHFFVFFLVEGNKLILSEVLSSMCISFRRILGLRTPLGVLNALWGYFIPCTHAMEIMLMCHSHLQCKGYPFMGSHYYQKGYAIYNLIPGWGGHRIFQHSKTFQGPREHAVCDKQNGVCIPSGGSLSCLPTSFW